MNLNTFSVTVSADCRGKGNAAVIHWHTEHKWTLTQLFAHLTRDGYPVAIGLYKEDSRRKDNFICSQLIGLDFDELTPDSARALIADNFVKEYAAFSYSTPSHLPENPRMRLFFATDKPITNVAKYEQAVLRLMHRFRHYRPDKACKDAARFFYGNPAPDRDYTRLIGQILPLDVINTLSDAYQDSHTLQPDLPPEFIEAVISRLELTGQKRGEFLECRCPIHPPDTTPSAGWHPAKNILYCFHESRTFLAKEAGEALGIRLADYSNGHSNHHSQYNLRNQPQTEDTSPLAIIGQFPELDAEKVAEYAARNEYGDAQLLILLTGKRIVFDHSEKAWYWWAGNWWKKDTLNKTPELLYSPVGERYAVATGEFATRLAKLEGMPDKDEQAIEQTRTTAQELSKRPKALRTHKRAQNVLSITSSLNSLQGNEWDSNPVLLGVQNGVIDLKNGQLRRGRLDEYIRKVTAIEFDPSATANRWERFILEIVADDKELAAFIQRLFGYFITGQTSDHVLPVFYGRGRNGKDTLVETLAYVLGEYASAGSGDLLIEQSAFRGQAQPHLYNLMGRRLVWVTETGEGARLNVNQVKYLTGAGRITARPLYGDFVEFDTTHHIILFTNHKPRVPSENEDYAIWKRLLLIPLTLSFVENPVATHERKRDASLKHKLKAESAGILNWLIHGCLEWQRQGLNPPQAVVNATADYAKSEDIIGMFIEERCELHPMARQRANELHTAFVQWAKENGYPEIGIRKFGERLTEQFQKERSNMGVQYTGLKILPINQ